MTMILTALGQDTGLFALGDVLLSAPGRSRPGLPLPLQFEPKDRSAAGYGIVGFAQKIVPISPTAFASWAGSHIVARVLMRDLRKAARADDLIDLKAIAETSELSDTELARIGIILCQRADSHVRLTSLNASAGNVHGVDAVWDGTGAFDFLNDTILETGSDLADFRTILRGLMVRVATSLASEAMYETPYDFLYGGWFELVISRTMGLKKIPYALKFWGRRGQEIGYDAPLFFNWYRGGTLYICSLEQRSDASDIRVLEIPDLLSSKPPGPVSIKPVCRPEFTFHVVMDEALPHFEIYVSDRHSEGHIEVDFGKRGTFEMRVKRAFLDMLADRKAAPLFTVRKASDTGT